MKCNEVIHKKQWDHIPISYFLHLRGLNSLSNIGDSFLLTVSVGAGLEGEGVVEISG